MDTDSTLHMREEVYGPAIAMRRASRGLSRETHKACLLFDGFKGNDSTSGEPRRNCSTSQLEANSSAHMQPRDAVHAQFRCLTDLYEDVAFGFNDDPFARQARASVQLFND